MAPLARRSLRHPGPAAEPRVLAAPVRLAPVAGTLRPGRTVADEIARLFRESGAPGGVLELRGGRCRPYRYVIPARSRDGVHAAWYSDTFDPPGGAALAEAVAIAGLEAGEPFLHCHGRWRPAAPGFPEAGHMLAPDCVVEAPVEARGLAAHGAAFHRLPDRETAFSLFAPLAEAAGPAGANGLLLRLRPGEDVAEAVEEACRAAGVARARLHGIGSVDGVRFADGGRVDCAATEIFLAGGTLDAAGARLPVVVVDTEGAVRAGTLARGDNPVGVTFEIVVEAVEGDA